MFAAPTAASVPTASRFARIGASFLDFVILIFAQRLGAYLGGIMAAVIMTARGAPQVVLEQEIERGISFGATFWGLCFVAMNYGVLQGIWGGTAGKLLCGLRVVNTDGSPIGVFKSLLRTGLYLVSAIPMYAGFVMALWDRQVRTLHDRFCGTIVSSSAGAVDAVVESPMPIPVQPLLAIGEAPEDSRRAA